MAVSVRPRVELVRATERAAALLANLLELYLHDLSEAFPIQPGADGRFGYGRLARYWQEPERHFAFLIHSSSQLAGFALATRGSPVTDDPEHLDVAEFFVLRGLRRSGVGRLAAFTLWDRMPGHWVVRVAHTNRRGMPFWREVVSEYASQGFSMRTVEGRSGALEVFEFDAAAASRPRGSGCQT